MHPAPKASLKAFTLVEVALSIAIVAFALIAILSLISVSLRNFREANVRHALTLTVDQTISMYQGESFTNALSLVQSQTNYYFDNTGVLLPNATGAFFKSAVTNVTPVAASTNYLANLQLRVMWPVPQLTTTNYTVFSVLNSR